MYAKILFTFIATIYASTSLAETFLDLQPLLDQQNLVMHQMLRKMSQRGASNIAVDNIVTCFDWYNSKQNSITTTYNTELNQCVGASVEAKQLLSAQSAEKRSNLAVRGHSVCSQLTECEAFDDALDFFTCYKTVGSNNSQILYDISAGSESLLNSITISYQRVDDTERVCTADARNLYISNLSTSATNLNNCLIGAWVPPSQAATDATTETPAATEPTTTTEAAEESPQRVFPEEDVYRYISKRRINM